MLTCVMCTIGPMVVKASNESCQEVTKHIATPPTSRMELLSREPIMDWIGCTCGEVGGVIGAALTMKLTSLVSREVSWPLLFPSKKAMSYGREPPGRGVEGGEGTWMMIPLNSWHLTVLARRLPTTLKSRLCSPPKNPAAMET
jgi:hypothetical protein